MKNKLGGAVIYFLVPFIFFGMLLLLIQIAYFFNGSEVKLQILGFSPLVFIFLVSLFFAYFGARRGLTAVSEEAKSYNKYHCFNCGLLVEGQNWGLTLGSHIRPSNISFWEHLNFGANIPYDCVQCGAQVDVNGNDWSEENMPSYLPDTTKVPKFLGIALLVGAAFSMCFFPLRYF